MNPLTSRLETVPLTLRTDMPRRTFAGSDSDGVRPGGFVLEEAVNRALSRGPVSSDLSSVWRDTLVAERGQMYEGRPWRGKGGTDESSWYFGNDAGRCQLQGRLGFLVCSSLSAQACSEK